MVWATMQMQGPNHFCSISPAAAAVAVATLRTADGGSRGEGMGVGGQGRKEATGTKRSPRKKMGRAPPEGSARWFCMREKGAEGSAQDGGRQEDTGG